MASRPMAVVIEPEPETFEVSEFSTEEPAAELVVEEPVAEAEPATEDKPRRGRPRKADA